MKLPKQVKRYNPTLRKHTLMNVTLAKKRTPGSASPMSKQSKSRTSFGKGQGNRGRYSKPPINKFKMAGKKRSKKTDIRYQCTESKKMFVRQTTIRAKKVEFI